MPSKRVRKGTTHWVGQVARKGLRKEKVFKTKTEAQKWENNLKELLEGSIPVEDIKRLLEAGLSPLSIPEVWEQEQTPMVSLLEWASAYLDYAQMAVSDGMFREKRSILSRFLKQHGKPQASVESLTVSQVYDHLQRQAKSRSGNAANKDRTHLGAAWKWGIRYDKCPAPNPFFRVDKFHHDKQHHYMPPMEDFLKVVGVADRQDRVLLWTYYHTAGRRQEILNLRWDDVDFNQQRLRLYTRKRKGGNLEADWVDMTDDLAALILEHREAADSEWVFVKRSRGKGYLEPFRTGRKKWPKALCKRAGVKPFGCHGIRALTATTLAYGDAPMVAIKQHLRHKNLSTTEAYIRGVASIRPYLRVLEGGSPQKRHVA